MSPVGGHQPEQCAVGGVPTAHSKGTGDCHIELEFELDIELDETSVSFDRMLSSRYFILLR